MESLLARVLRQFSLSPVPMAPINPDEQTAFAAGLQHGVMDAEEGREPFCDEDPTYWVQGYLAGYEKASEVLASS